MMSFRMNRGCKRTVLTILLALLFNLMPSAKAQIADSALKQIQEIGALKRSFTSAERKMSFNLVLISRAARNELPEDLKGLIDTKTFDSSGKTIVEVEGYMTPSLLSNSAMAGVDKIDGQVPQANIASGRIRARVLSSQLLQLAGQRDVVSLHEPERYTTNVGSLTSQGYVSHGANKAIALGVTGAGVRVGVLSDSASAAGVSALIASGDLPADTTVLPGQQGSGEDEGTAMMEIVHDMAPDAKLFFATADPSQAQFAANIRSLRFTYHCDIIVDDVTYFAEGAFQDGTVAQAVNDVTTDGALYFSAAANSGNLTSGTSGTWEGDFLAGPPGSGALTGAGTLHNFQTGGSPIYYDALTAVSTFISLKWSDPLGGSANDYDLYLLNAAGTSVVAASAASQTGTQDPLEAISGNFTAGERIVVILFDGVQRALRVDTNRGVVAIQTDGSTYGHNAAANTITMAATYWNSAHTGPKLFVGGSANPIETFSSDGPRKIFYTPAGAAITAGNFLFSTNGGTTLQKPDATAADGVTVKTPGFNPFYGTSAAAPHAAGIAALVKSANLNLTNLQIRQILTSTTLDNMAAGVDRDSGYGILMALPAVQAAQAIH
ncbi:S8 family peptidase [Terriglobus saanensis]|nr:S8 family serine peptidase [Terriglobus saanensis]